jgi:very-short-patch-repair endonuclease
VTQQLSIGDLVTNEAIRPAVKRQAKKREKESPEDVFDFQCRAYKLPAATRQVSFAKQAMGRQWRADFCFEQYKLLVEIDGLVPYHVGKGRHQTIGGQEGDMQKGNAAVLLGYSVLHFSQGMVKKGEAIDITMRTLTARGWKP